MREAGKWSQPHSLCYWSISKANMGQNWEFSSYTQWHFNDWIGAFFFFFTTNVIGELFSLLHFTSKLKRAVNICHLILFWTAYQLGFCPYHSSKSALIKAQMTSKHSQIQGSPLSPHLVWSKANVWHITFLFCSLFSLTSRTSFFFKINVFGG